MMNEFLPTACVHYFVCKYDEQQCDAVCQKEHKCQKCGVRFCDTIIRPRCKGTCGDAECEDMENNWNLYNKQEYVVGFLFDFNGVEVALIKKKRPNWQAGKLNGIGGKIDLGETPYAAMCREFYEEAGVDIKDWSQYAVLRGKEYAVYFFCAFNDAINGIKSMTDEIVDTYEISSISSLPVILNLRWLIPMALSMDCFSVNYFEINEVKWPERSFGTHIREAINIVKDWFKNYRLSWW